METSTLYTVMLKELVLGVPSFTLFFVVNLACTLLVAGISLFRFLKNNYILARFSVCFTVFICFFYQVPLVLFSQQLEVSLSQPWFYAAVVNGGALALSLWSIVTRRLDFRGEPSSFPEKQALLYLVTGLLGLASLAIYLSSVPLECTGLYALFFDPWLTLLARELSVKLIGTSLSTYALGAYANAVAPIFILLSVWLVRNSLLCRRFFGVLVGAVAGILAIFAVLISGTKGLLMPTMLLLVAGAYFWCKTWLSRLSTIVLAVAFLVFSLVTFELLKERGAIVGGAYDFAGCAAKTGSCQKSQDMLESMKSREQSLGLPNVYIQPLQLRLDCLCSADGDETSCPTQVLGREGGGEVPLAELAKQTEILIDKQAERSATFVSALFNRMLVVPFQVSVWNFMYAESETVDGAKTLPFARRFLGESLNMPELVYQKYGVVYSQGDKTSTSTAPTSFFLSYPAYLGWLGLLIALGAVVALDLFIARFAYFIGASLIPLLVGSVLVLCMNFMTSDFVTVLISHGGAAGILVLSIHALLLKKNSR